MSMMLLSVAGSRPVAPAQEGAFCGASDTEVELAVGPRYLVV